MRFGYRDDSVVISGTWNSAEGLLRRAGKLPGGAQAGLATERHGALVQLGDRGADSTGTKELLPQCEHLVQQL